MVGAVSYAAIALLVSSFVCACVALGVDHHHAAFRRRFPVMLHRRWLLLESVLVGAGMLSVSLLLAAVMVMVM